MSINDFSNDTSQQYPVKVKLSYAITNNCNAMTNNYKIINNK